VALFSELSIGYSTVGLYKVKTAGRGGILHKTLYLTLPLVGGVLCSVQVVGHLATVT